MCVFESSIPPSISVTKKQEVWGEYGMYRAHEHKFLFKIIHKRHLKISKKEIQILPKSSSRDHLKAKKHSGAARAVKNTILGGQVRHRARQEDPKLDLQTEPRAPKNKDLYLMPKSISLEASLETTD